MNAETTPESLVESMCTCSGNEGHCHHCREGLRRCMAKTYTIEEKTEDEGRIEMEMD